MCSPAGPWVWSGGSSAGWPRGTCNGTAPWNGTGAEPVTAGLTGARPSIHLPRVTGPGAEDPRPPPLVGRLSARTRGCACPRPPRQCRTMPASSAAYAEHGGKDRDEQEAQLVHRPDLRCITHLQHVKVADPPY